MTISRPERLEQGIGIGLLILIAVMPFHAFLSVWIGSLIGRQEIIQAWKELLVFCLAIATLLLVYAEPNRLNRGGKWLPISAISFAVIALIITIFARPNISAIIYGLKIDLEFIIVFFIALYGTSSKLVNRLPNIILITSGLVAGFAVLHATLLPPDILTHFGYGSDTIVPYQLVGSLSDTIRTPSTLGGPNQLGSFLILPLCLAIVLWLKQPRWAYALSVILSLAGIWFTYSRSAWIGALAGIVIAIVATLKQKRQLVIFGAGITAAFLALLSLILIYGKSNSAYKYLILHSGSGIENNNSTTQHADALVSGLQTVVSRPLGSGLGSAGPASFHANSGLIPENYYLQIAIETGIAGLIAFATFIAATGYQLWQMRFKHVMAPALIGSLLGISIINLFLHGWADSSTALIFWSSAGITLAHGGKHV